jgi:hypothetical protein
LSGAFSEEAISEKASVKVSLLKMTLIECSCSVYRIADGLRLLAAISSNPSHEAKEHSVRMTNPRWNQRGFRVHGLMAEVQKDRCAVATGGS